MSNSDDKKLAEVLDMTESYLTIHPNKLLSELLNYTKLLKEANYRMRVNTNYLYHTSQQQKKESDAEITKLKQRIQEAEYKEGCWRDDCRDCPERGLNWDGCQWV